jgi:hypothetical protein
MLYSILYLCFNKESHYAQLVGEFRFTLFRFVFCASIVSYVCRNID